MHSLCSVSSACLLTLPCSFTAGLPHISAFGRRTQDAQAMEFIGVVINHGWHPKDKMGRKALRWEDVSVWVWAMPSSAIPRVRAGKEWIYLKTKLRAVLVPGLQFFTLFFPSRTLSSIICRSFGAPWTEELPVGWNAPKYQIKPEVSVLELLNLLQGISWHLTVRHEGLAGPLLVCYSLAQIFRCVWGGPAWLLLAFTKEAHPSLPGTQQLPKYTNSACTLPSGRKVWRVVKSA